MSQALPQNSPGGGRLVHLWPSLHGRASCVVAACRASVLSHGSPQEGDV